MSTLDRAIEQSREALVGTPGKLAAGVVVGMGVGLALRQDRVVVPAIGPVPSVALGLVLFALGGAAFVRLQRLSTGCDCEGECTCS